MCKSIMKREISIFLKTFLRKKKKRKKTEKRKKDRKKEKKKGTLYLAVSDFLTF